jgi:hypothetical protein
MYGILLYKHYTKHFRYVTLYVQETKENKKGSQKEEVRRGKEARCLRSMKMQDDDGRIRRCRQVEVKTSRLFDRQEGSPCDMVQTRMDRTDGHEGWTRQTNDNILECVLHQSIMCACMKNTFTYQGTFRQKTSKTKEEI